MNSMHSLSDLNSIEKFETIIVLESILTYEQENIHISNCSSWVALQNNKLPLNILTNLHCPNKQ